MTAPTYDNMRAVLIAAATAAGLTFDAANDPVKAIDEGVITRLPCQSGIDLTISDDEDGFFECTVDVGDDRGADTIYETITGTLGEAQAWFIAMLAQAGVK